MPIGTYAPGADAFDHAVDFGGLRYEMFFGDGPDCIALPSTPPVAAVGVGQCLCPSCDSQGWFTETPVCKYWRAHCEACGGRRVYSYWHTTGHPPSLERCSLCIEEWARQVAWFRYALRSPRAAAQELRKQATRARAVAEQAR
ncbi:MULTISPECIES: hypothetical protein [Actinosynnema]|uniref:hypothetical protein n=1 Tax=Actinosynnema TaxID=40566 RepID=UPI0020A31AA5|nr:hypothetical protein [Actinosynnema pretiosum]MCP2097495.1 hypothetical protein [Actinosynnema pretiosum]